MGVMWASDPFRERIEQLNRARWDGGTVLTMADATAPPHRWDIQRDQRPAITPAAPDFAGIELDEESDTTRLGCLTSMAFFGISAALMAWAIDRLIRWAL